MMGIGSSWLRSMLLPAYFYGSWPCRRFSRLVAGYLGCQPIVVLFYHRVADSHPTPWTISRSGFRRQLDWLVQHFEIVSLEESQRRLSDKHTGRASVCITFDDGYAENCDFAIPELITRGLPFTYFVASNYVLGGHPFPHDVALGTPLAPNTVVQLRSMVQAGVEIGAHSRSHRDLGPVHDTQILRDEIEGSREDLEQSLGVAVRYFAFPYGQHAHLNSSAFQIARDAGFQAVCSAYGGYNFPGEDLFHFQREHGDPNFLRFRNRMLMDPRVVATIPRFAYESKSELRRDPAGALGIAKDGGEA